MADSSAIVVRHSPGRSVRQYKQGPAERESLKNFQFLHFSLFFKSLLKFFHQRELLKILNCYNKQLLVGAT